jgi:hypothetical protein
MTELIVGADALKLVEGKSTIKDAQNFMARVQYLYDHPGEKGHDEFEMLDGRVIDRYTETLAALNGEYLGRVWFFRDITERKHAASALAYRDRLLHAVMVGTNVLVKSASMDQGMPEALRIVGESLQVASW